MSAKVELEILFQDDCLVAMNKPSGLVVHPSYETTDRNTCMSILRDQVGKFVYPLHRLDRGTSGVLLMGLDSDTARTVQTAFMERQIKKTYLTVVRGWSPPEGTLDRPLKKTKTLDVREEATTHFQTLAHGVLPFPVGSYPEARYSLVQAMPVTGRRHQIRKHLSNANHPVVGDTIYGDGKHNRLFRSLFDCYHVLLHALQIELQHPQTREPLSIAAPLPDDFLQVCDRLGWNDVLAEKEAVRVEEGSG